MANLVKVNKANKANSKRFFVGVMTSLSSSLGTHVQLHINSNI